MITIVARAAPPVGTSTKPESWFPFETNSNLCVVIVAADGWCVAGACPARPAIRTSCRKWFNFIRRVRYTQISWHSHDYCKQAIARVRTGGGPLAGRHEADAATLRF